MYKANIFPGFRVVSMETDEDSSLVLQLVSAARGGYCPSCKQRTTSLHSHYVRTLSDLLLCGYRVILRLQARRFRCRNARCPQHIFTERFPDFVEPFQRNTKRLRQALEAIGFALGGQGGSRLCHKLNMPTSGDTLLRLVRQASIQIPNVGRVIGIDDWAYCRGQRYGTLICDLVNRTPVDLLPDRSVESVANWIRLHPNVQVVSRDRAGLYAEGIRKGNPHILQVADRWHLLKNLGDTLLRYFERHKPPQRHGPDIEEAEDDRVPDRTHLSRREEKQKQRREQKWEMIRQVQDLHRKGIKVMQLARMFDLDRKTVRKYLTLDHMPETVRRARTTVLDPYKATVKQLLLEGYDGPQILSTIRAMGYPGSRSVLSEYLAKLRKGKPATDGQRHRITPRQLTVLMGKPDERCTEEEKRWLQALTIADSSYEVIRELTLSLTTHA